MIGGAYGTSRRRSKGRAARLDWCAVSIAYCGHVEHGSAEAEEAGEADAV